MIFKGLCSLTISGVFAFVASSALAQTDGSQCTAVADPDSRLSCYDGIFREVTVSEPAGEWDVRVDKSKLDDTTEVVLSLSSREPVRNRYGQSEDGRLIIRCLENSTSIYVIWAGHFMADLNGGGRVDYRIDDKPASRKNFTESTDHQALGLWNGGTSIPFIKDMFGASTLYVRATPMSESTVEMEFNIAGLEEASAPLREACGW